MKKILIILLIIGVAVGLYAYYKLGSVYESNVDTQGKEVEFFIYTGSTYEQVEGGLFELGILEDEESFKWVAEKKKYPGRIRKGRYIIEDGMSNNDLVDMLRAGNQVPVKVSFNNVRNLSQLAGKLSQRLAPDSTEFLVHLTDRATIEKYGFEPETFISMFIPNTYELYWTTSAEDFVERMAKEFKAFWTDDRLAKARLLGLTQSEVVTLASIVQAEQSANPAEWRTIAGLYLNRIKRDIPLQSDPTVIFAVGDFGIKRVLNKHLKFKNPYNTYVNTGLPPGPIRMPDIGCVDAVLNPEKHDYIFMCADASLIGKHHFSKTNREHERHARAYRQEMDRQKVFE